MSTFNLIHHVLCLGYSHDLLIVIMLKSASQSSPTGSSSRNMPLPHLKPIYSHPLLLKLLSNSFPLPINLLRSGCRQPPQLTLGPSSIPYFSHPSFSYFLWTPIVLSASRSLCKLVSACHIFTHVLLPETLAPPSGTRPLHYPTLVYITLWLTLRPPCSVFLAEVTDYLALCVNICLMSMSSMEPWSSFVYFFSGFLVCLDMSWVLTDSGHTTRVSDEGI